jgi:hypothetical protein
MSQASIEPEYDGGQSLDETRQRVFLQSNGVFDHELEYFCALSRGSNFCSAARHWTRVSLSA